MILRIHGKTLVSDGYYLQSKSYLTVWTSLTWLHYWLFLQEAASFTKVARDKGSKEESPEREGVASYWTPWPEEASFAGSDFTVVGLHSPRNVCDGADFSVAWTPLIQRRELWSAPKWKPSQAMLWSKWKRLTAQNFILHAKPLKKLDHCGGSYR